MAPFSTVQRVAGRGLLAASVVAGFLVSATASQAQFFIDAPDAVISPRVVVASLARRGFQDISHPYFDGDTYAVEAVNPRGVRVRLTIDAVDGSLLDRRTVEAPIYPPRNVGRPGMPGYGWTDVEPGPPEMRPDTRRAERVQPRTAPRPPTVASAPPAPLPSVPGAAPGNALGLNPDAAATPRREPAPRKDARIKPPEAAKAAPAAQPSVAKPAPAAAVAPAVAPPAPAISLAAPAEAKAPPAEAAPRQVRVIEGVTSTAPAAKEDPAKAPPAPAVPGTPPSSPTE